MGLTNLLIPEGLSKKIDIGTVAQLKSIDGSQYGRDKLHAKTIGPLPFLADFNYDLNSGNILYSGLKNFSDLFTGWYKENKAKNFFKDEKINKMRKRLNDYLNTINEFDAVYRTFYNAYNQEIQNSEDELNQIKSDYNLKKQAFNVQIDSSKNNFFGIIKKSYLNISKGCQFMKYSFKTAREKLKLFGYETRKASAEEKLSEIHEKHSEVTALKNRISRIEDVYVSYLLNKKMLLN